MFDFYLIGQLIGTILGLLLARGTDNVELDPFTIDDPTVLNVIRAILNEAMGTFIMVFFILQITNPNTTFI